MPASQLPPTSSCLPLPSAWLFCGMKCPDILNNNEGTISVGSTSSTGPSPDLCDRSGWNKTLPRYTEVLGSVPDRSEMVWTFREELARKPYEGLAVHADVWPWALTLDSAVFFPASQRKGTPTLTRVYSNVISTRSRFGCPLDGGRKHLPCGRVGYVLTASMNPRSRWRQARGIN